MFLQMSELLLAKAAFLKVPLFVVRLMNPPVFLQMPFTGHRFSASITNVVFSIMLRIIMPSILRLRHKAFLAMFTMHSKLQCMPFAVNYIVRFAIEMLATFITVKRPRLVVKLPYMPSKSRIGFKTRIADCAWKGFFRFVHQHVGFKFELSVKCLWTVWAFNQGVFFKFQFWFYKTFCNFYFYRHPPRSKNEYCCYLILLILF